MQNLLLHFVSSITGFHLPTCKSTFDFYVRWWCSYFQLAKLHVTKVSFCYFIFQHAILYIIYVQLQDSIFHLQRHILLPYVHLHIPIFNSQNYGLYSGAWFQFSMIFLIFWGTFHFFTSFYNLNNLQWRWSFYQHCMFSTFSFGNIIRISVSFGLIFFPEKCSKIKLIFKPGNFHVTFSFVKNICFIRVHCMELFVFFKMRSFQIPVALWLLSSFLEGNSGLTKSIVNFLDSF